MAGRPKINLDVLPIGWKKEITNMYTNGASDVEVKAYLYNSIGSFSNDLWDRWIEEEPEFSETIKKGKVMSEAWWNRNGRINLQNRDFNYTGWYMQMKNRFSWSDKQHIDHTTDGEKLIMPKFVMNEQTNRDKSD